VNLTLIITIIIAGAIIIALKLLIEGKRPSEDINYAYESRRSLLTKAETTFYHALSQAVGDQYRVFSKVRMEDIIQVKRGLNRKEAYGLRSRIKSRHIDFVLCDPENLSIQVCVELDDRSHQRADRQKRDAFVNQAMEAAGVRLVRIPTSRSYEEVALANLISPAPAPVETPE
jgi:very-short-patch-repair endonuclease